jgi:hypothetical protein
MVVVAAGRHTNSLASAAQHKTHPCALLSTALPVLHIVLALAQSELMHHH